VLQELKEREQVRMPAHRCGQQVPTPPYAAHLTTPSRPTYHVQPAPARRPSHPRRAAAAEAASSPAAAPAPAPAPAPGAEFKVWAGPGKPRDAHVTAATRKGP
jgi:hypothetical protein